MTCQYLYPSYFLHCMLRALCLLGFLNLSSCFCNQKAIEPVATIAMEIPTTQLVGDDKQVKVHFNIKDATLLDKYELRVVLIEQKTMGAKEVLGTTQVTYKDATGTLQTFATAYRGTLRLSTLIAPNDLDIKKNHQVAFNLTPTEQVSKLNMQFELLQLEDNTKVNVVTSIFVQWILKPILFNIVTDDKGQSYFTLQNLQQDIKDLNQVIVSIQSLQGATSFDIGGAPKSQATLAELLPNTQVIAQDQETQPIKLMIDHSKQGTNQKEVFSIVVLPKEDSSTFKRQEEQSIPVLDPKLKATIKETVQEFYRLQEESKDSVEDAKYLEDLEDILEEETQHISNQEKEEKELSIQENKNKTLRELELKTQQALQDKSPAEQRAIRKAYQQKKRKILLDSIKQRLRNRLERTKGSLNALGHNLFFTSIKEPRTPAYAEGQQMGHKVAVAMASVLAAIGSGFISVGLFVATVGAPVTLGAIETIAIPTILFGALLVSYSIFTTLRAQKKLPESAEAYAANIEKDLVGRYMKLIDKIKAARAKRASKKDKP